MNHLGFARFLLATVVVTLASSPAAAGSVDVLGSVGTLSVPVTSLREAKFKATLKQQYDFSCGSAALAALLHFHYHYPVTEEQVFREMYDRGDQDKIRGVGFSLLDMKRYLETIGYQADGIRGPLDTLLEWNLPAIVLINDRGYRHFVIVKGVRPDRVLIGDPAAGMRAIARADFEGMWNGILFVVRDHPRLAGESFNLERDWQLMAHAPVASIVPEETSSKMLLAPPPSDF